MAAAAATIRNFLADVIGINDGPVGNIHQIRDKVRDEGLDQITDLVEFDDEDVKILCASVRKPGGSIQDPNDATRTIPDPGHSIAAICEKRLRLACYGARLYDLIGRPIAADSLSRARLRQFEKHQQTIENHEDPENMPEISKSFGIMKALDMFPMHLRERIGARKVALSYVVRDDENPKPLEPLVNNNITSASYETIMDEMISRVPLSGPEYIEDNAKAYQIIQDLVAGTSHESSIKSFRRSRDGRSAYLALVQHNLGSSKWDKIIDSCETYLLRNEWNGRNVRFTLKMHIGKHREAHNELVRASQFVQYEVPNEHTRVTRLIKSITSKDAAILAAIAFIQGTAAKRDDFESAADYLLLTAPTPKDIERSYRVSALAYNGGSGDDNNQGGKKKDIGKTGVEFRYYKRAEYEKLNGKQKAELHEWRKSKGSTSGNNQAAKISSLESKLQEMVTANEAMSVKISSLTTKLDERSSDPLKNPLTQRSS